MPNEDFQRRSYAVSLPCEYLLKLPSAIDERTPLVVSLHGYGMNPADMLRLTSLAVGAHPIVAVLRAPYQHYASQLGANAHVAYNWGVSKHWEDAVQLHHEMVRTALAKLSAEFGIGAGRTILLGFSQPVGLNYRLIGTSPGLVRGVIGICGGVPRDWEEDKYGKIGAAILHISRDQDEFYPAERALEFPGRLRRYASDVEFHMLPGEHRFPSKAAGIIQAWMARLLPT